MWPRGHFGCTEKPPLLGWNSNSCPELSTIIAPFLSVPNKVTPPPKGGAMCLHLDAWNCEADGTHPTA